MDYAHDSSLRRPLIERPLSGLISAGSTLTYAEGTDVREVVESPSHSCYVVGGIFLLAQQ